MNIKSVAWTCAVGTAAVTVAGIFVNSPALAIASVGLGGAAMVSALRVRYENKRMRVSEKMLEQLR